MFDLIDNCTLFCGGSAASGLGPENEAELSLKEHSKDNAADEEAILDPVDSIDAKNYLVVHLTRPIGILFEENHDDQYGGAFVAEINEGCNAAADGSINCGDQLVAIGTKRVSGMDFEAMKLVFDSVETETKLSFFRGPAESLYGPSGANIEWLNEFVAEREEDNERETSPDNGHVPVHLEVLDDAALAAAALNGDVVEKAEESSSAVEDDVGSAESVECNAEDTIVIDYEDDEDEKIQHDFQVENEADALATFVGNYDVECDAISEVSTPNRYGTKGILTESCYSPKGVDEIEAFVDSLESDPVCIDESNDDDSAVSSIWSESDDYIGELEELPMERVSALAALGAASTLTANMMLS